MTDEEIEQFLDALARPMWVWRAARGMLEGEHKDGVLRGAEKRRVNALNEIRTLIQQARSEDGKTEVPAHPA